MTSKDVIEFNTSQELETMNILGSLHRYYTDKKFRLRLHAGKGFVRLLEILENPEFLF